MPGGLADVVSLPVRTAAIGARSVLEWSDNQVDDWGRDPDFVGRMWALSRVRWNVAVGGQQLLPARAGGLIVVNARRFALAPVFAALAIGGAIDRPVRFVGRPDVAPVGPMVQRLGGLLTRVDELTNVLRSGQLVVMGAAHTRDGRDVGVVDHRLVGAAVAAKVKVFPAAAASSPARRGARVEIGPEVPVNRRRRGPLAELELADDVTVAVRELLAGLDTSGGYLR